jgi:hypothetical protein
VIPNIENRYHVLPEYAHHPAEEPVCTWQTTPFFCAVVNVATAESRDATSVNDITVRPSRDSAIVDIAVGTDGETPVPGG